MIRASEEGYTYRGAFLNILYSPEMKSMSYQSTVFDSLQDLCGRGETGRLDIRKGPFGGTIYLQGGNVIDLDLQGRKGTDALLEMLAWSDGAVCWFQGATPYRHTCHLPLFELEALWFGAEGGGSKAEGRCAPTARATTGSQAIGIFLPRLGQYEIVLQAQDPAHRPSQHVLGQPLKPAYLIGGSHECDIHIDHYSVCQMHAALMVEDNIIRMWDLGSNNATHVNGDLVDEAILQSGDVIQIGDIAFRMTLRAQRAPAEQPDATVRRPTFRKPTPASAPAGPLRLESILAEKRRRDTTKNPLFRLFDTLRSGKTPRR